MNKIIEKFRDKKILILGFAREGQSTYKFLRKHYPEKKLYVADQKPLSQWDGQTISKIRKDQNATLHFGKKYLDNLSNYDLVFKSPGIPSKLSQIKRAQKAGVEFSSQTQLFFKLTKGKIIGITGTKGKSTTASLIHHILSSAGLNSVLLGNIGKPCLDFIGKDSKDTYYVFELSSHQLSDLKKSPHIAVFLNIYKEHLDYYEEFEDYFRAKANIALHQNPSDYFVYNKKFERLIELAKETKSKTYFFSDKVDTGYRLAGKHNLENIAASSLVAKILKIDGSVIKKAISSFKPLSGRLEVVGKVNGITFVNDTLATIPEATIAAIDAFSDVSTTLILGGYDRKIDFSTLSDKIVNTKNIKTVVLIGKVSLKIKNSLLETGYKGKVVELGMSKMKKIVQTAFKSTPRGGVVLLSPAAASFDMFKNYEDRGDQFKDAVGSLSLGGK